MTLDTIASALAVDDKWVASVSAHKVPVRRRTCERLEIEAEVRPLPDQAEFERLCVESAGTR